MSCHVRFVRIQAIHAKQDDASDQTYLTVGCGCPREVLLDSRSARYE